MTTSLHNIASCDIGQQMECSVVDHVSSTASILVYWGKIAKSLDKKLNIVADLALTPFILLQSY